MSTMLIPCKILALTLITTFLFCGCAGTRESYLSLIDETTDSPTIVMRVGESKEVLAIGNGFPGRWGYYPALRTLDTSVASVTCREQRSVIPFREPGVIFGGSVCFLTAHRVGETCAQYGNQFTMAAQMCHTEDAQHGRRFNVVVLEP